MIAVRQFPPKEQGHTEPRIADLNFMVHLLISVISKYQRLLKLTDAHGDFYFKARVLNAWRILPFIDVESILDEFNTHGIPMIMDSTVTIPTGTTPDSLKVRTGTFSPTNMGYNL